ncbi:MAG TPA: bifunctional glutamate N-acetyltransferase/amino-acid acetyltransferase ArgJ [Caulobacteraceae bacterium]|nr:bifunctional glutamate N-acetyltransferase/amino-acid acetyltransferase ArgJ [Caulobacteraceae bacterium]
MSDPAGFPVSPLAVPFPAIPPIAGAVMAAGSAGLYGRPRDDLLLMHFAPQTSCAGVFTRHGVGSAPVDWCKRMLGRSRGRGVRGVVVNAGCANSFTGKAGGRAARAVAETAGKLVGAKAGDVLLASTGVIGVLLDDASVRRALPDLAGRLTADGWDRAARAIMTTDTFPKGAFAEADIGGRRVRLAGIAKGSGMVAPDMATVLAFVVTDAAIAPKALDTLLKRAVVRTFNAVTVDGDRSTNDTLLLFATGGAGGERIDKAKDPRLADFAAKLEALLLDLARQLVRDGEGASKFIEIRVSGAKSEASARKIARTVAESPLVKTAFAGEDANWGRIVMAVGRADEPIRRERLSIAFGPHRAAAKGAVAPDYSEETMSAYMKRPELEVAIDVGVGRARATMWTCDLTKRYVEINGDYRS